MTAAVSSSTLSDLGLGLKSSTTKKDQLGQQDFLKLLTTQLTNQDPTKPLDSTQFLGQIAQFSTVSGIQDLQKSFDALSSSLGSSQSLQAASLVGHGVLYPSSTGYLDAKGGLSGGVDLPSAGQLVVEITDAGGQVVRRLDYGTKAAGTAYFNWDGTDGSGATLPPGSYGMRASLIQNGSAQALSTLAAGMVESVSVGSSGLNLNLSGLGPVAFSDVRQIL